MPLRSVVQSYAALLEDRYHLINAVRRETGRDRQGRQEQQAGNKISKQRDVSDVEAPLQQSPALKIVASGKPVKFRVAAC